MIARSPGRGRNGTCEAKLDQIQAIDECIDDTDERVRPNIVINTRRKQIGLTSRYTLNEAHRHLGDADRRGLILHLFVHRQRLCAGFLITTPRRDRSISPIFRISENGGERRPPAIGPSEHISGRIGCHWRCNVTSNASSAEGGTKWLVKRSKFSSLTMKSCPPLAFLC